MNPVHLHLMLNHVPVLGTIFAAVLLGVGLFRRSAELEKVALWAFAFSAAFALPVFLTGEPAEHAVERLPGVLESAVETHEDVAKVALGAILLLGATAAAGLAIFRGRAMPRWLPASVLALAVVASSLLAWTANLGGKVRHSELRADSASSSHAAPRDRD